MGLSTTNNIVSEDVSPVHFIYGLMSGFALFFLPLFFALLINVTQPKSLNTLTGSHLRWQRYSIIQFLMGCTIAYLLPDVWGSFVVFALSTIWFIHRILKGWLSLADGQFIN